MFKKNDLVYWDSQAGGQCRRKCGRIVRVLKRADVMKTPPYRIATNDFPNHTRMFDGHNLPGRKTQVAYLVEVIDKPGNKPKLYMPYPSLLKPAGDLQWR